eukprot:1194560-Prymnesium_polylepis.1
MRDLCHPRLSSTQPVRPDANEHVDAAAEGPQFPGVAQALGDNQDGDAYWPPPREMVDFTLIEVFSLCNLPKVRFPTHQLPTGAAQSGAL